MNETTCGREPIQIVEIRQPFCALTYGVAPCTAALGITGDRKCFNVTSSCQDRENLTLTDFIYWRFAKPQANLPKDWHEEVVESPGTQLKTNLIPSLVSVSTSATRINIGGGSENESPFGRRASVSIVLQDHPWDDSIGDKYVTERDYDPFKRGTFWGKWLARNPFHSGWKVMVYDGYIGQSLAEMSSRLYLLDRIDGPDSNGRVRITAKDPLKLADDKRAQAPLATQATLRDAIDASQTTGIVIIAAQADLTEQLGNTATNYIRIGDEIIGYTGVTASSPSDNEWELTGVTRGTLGTKAEEHDAEEECQRVIRYENKECWLIAYDLLDKFAPGTTDFIDLDQWNDEAETWIPTFRFSGTIAEPTPVNELLAELTESGLFYIWWDERKQTIPLKAIRPVTEQPVLLTDRENIIADSFSLKVDPDQRISQVWVYFNQKNPTEDLDDIGNYANIRIRIDGDAESEQEYGQSRIRQIFSRWIVSDAQALQVAVRMLARYRDNPRYLTLRLDAKDRSLWTADVAEIEHFSMTDETGDPKRERWQVISVEEVQPGEIIQYDFQTFEFFGRFAFWMHENAPDYADATEDERRQGFWWADEDGKINGDEGYKWI